ncbi:MAG: PAS domain S-box protein [Myxococcales bacterium]|nr:MAG: PAS domain S-box protein [Myxococcales bacterium]
MTERKSHETLTSLLKGFTPFRKDAVVESHPDELSDDSTNLTSPSTEEVLEAVLAFASETSSRTDEDQLVRRFFDILKHLFPARRFAVRLIDFDELDLSLIVSTGSIFPAAKEKIYLSKESVEYHKLQNIMAESDHSGSLELTDHYVPIFDEDAFGFEVPLVIKDRILGILNVEYSPKVPILAEDRDIIRQFARPFANQLRNARYLHESLYLRNYLAKLLEHANAPIVVIGKHRRIKVANRAFLNLIGQSKESVLNMDFVELSPETERARLLPVFINALRGVPTSNFELRIHRHNHSFARLALNIASVLNPEGQVEGVICIGRDVTELRELEEQMIQAEKLATLGQLAAGVVHELNNPLTSISVYSDYLLKKARNSKIDPKDVDRLERISQSAERILRFTRDLAIYARPSTAEPKLVSIHDILDQAIVFCDHLVADRGVTIQRNYSTDVSGVFAIASQLHQVFINLITNACHATSDDQGLLVIRTRLNEKNNVQIEIEDNGIGISTENLGRIFEPFFTTKTEGEGTGLGLSIARNIVEQHNGKINVQSQEGKGTTFVLLLPGGATG